MQKQQKKPSPPMPATMDDIARETRLSKMTVSRALSHTGYVSERTKQRVLSAARRLNYEFNILGRQLTQNRSGLLGIITSFEGVVGTYYFGRIIEGLQQGLAGTDYHLTLYDRSSEDFNDGQKCARLWHQKRVDGLIVIAPLVDEPFIQTFYDLKAPLIVVGSSPSHQTTNCVDIDNFGAAAAATEHLIELGHRKIAFLAGPTDLSDAVQRRLGYLKTLERWGIPITKPWVIEAKYETRLAFVGSLEMLSKKNRPTAIFAANDLMAFGAIDAARSVGLQVPKDLSIVGFDDVRGADTATPPLTTVRQPLFQLGKAAAGHILEAISKGDTPPLREKLSAQLVVRSSTAAPAIKERS